jgi:hypothetical protein
MAAMLTSFIGTFPAHEPRAGEAVELSFNRLMISTVPLFSRQEDILEADDVIG